MRNKLLPITLTLASIAIVAMGFSSFQKRNSSKSNVSLMIAYATQGLDLTYHVPHISEINISTPINTEIDYTLSLGKSYIGFREALGFKESQGRYGIVNKFGYLGKYQFNINTLKLIGIHNAKRFLKDSKLQEAAFDANTARNKWILRRDIKRSVGKTIGGVYITESGILAAAHLSGAGNVKKFLRSGGETGFTDAFGTSIRYYLKKFSGYETSHIVPNKKARVTTL